MDNKILNNKVFLYLTEFFAGMSVMAVELGASRLLAPYFSSSQIVWTIIIGTIMIAMALGNIYGGRYADKNPSPDKLYGRILIAALWIGAIPFIGKYLIIGISAVVILSVSINYLIFAALFACLIIFVFPLFLLGTVTPSLVKYTTRDMSENGRVVGYLGAFNTVGSIIGTFLPTFVTIPAVGTSVTFLIFSGVLLTLSLIFFISQKKFRVRIPIAVILFVIFCIFGHGTSFAFWESDRLTYEGESIYNYLQVKEEGNNVILSTNVLFGVQSISKKDGSLSNMYYDYAMSAPFMTSKREVNDNKVLVLGMGSGTYAFQCREYLGIEEITGVEIDGKITSLAEGYFFTGSESTVYEYDGRAFLEADTEKYDVIMVDAYQDITIPFQMSSVEFFTLVKNHITDGGVMVVNMNMRSDSDDSIAAYLQDTVSEVFEDVYYVNVSGSANRELFAGNGDLSAVLEKNIENIEDRELRNVILNTSSGIKKYNAGNKVLTDDKAPVEVLGMKELDSLIGNEIEYYKEIFKKEGISGLIEAMS